MTFDITHLGKKNWLKEKCLFLEEKDLLNPFFPSCSSSTEEPPKAPSCKPSVCSDSMHTTAETMGDGILPNQIWTVDYFYHLTLELHLSLSPACVPFL